MMNYKELIAIDEGKRNKPYLDTRGNYTIGVGHFLGKTGFNAELRKHLAIPDDYMEKGITDVQIEQLFDMDLNRCLNQLKFYYKWFEELDDIRQAVMISMCFNLGILRLFKFIKTLGFIKDGEYDKAADEMLTSDWAKQIPNRAKRLSEMMRAGEWPK